MKIYKALIFIICVTTSFAFGNDIETVSYQSIPQLISNGEIEKAEIYDFGGNDIDAVFTKKNGSTVGVKGSIGLDDDAVLHQYLKDNNINYTVYDYEFEGSSKNKAFGSQSTLFMILPMLLMFGVPVLLVLILIKQSNTISKQAETIRILASKENSQSIK